MQLTTLRALFAHNDWARDRLLDAVLPLPDETLDDPVEMGPGSLRATIEHLWRAEQGWLDVWQGAVDSRPSADPGIAVADLRSRFRATAAERDAFLDERDEAEEIACTTGTGHSMRMALADMVLHVCNHGFHHRAQALNMLRRAGVQGPDIDYLHLCLDPSVKMTVSYDVGVIDRYYAYNDWARERVLDAAEPLDDERLDRPFEMGMGSLRKTLLHIRDAEQWWLQNWSGEPAELFSELPMSTPIAGLRKETREIARHRRALLESLDDGGLTRTVTARPGREIELSFNLGDTVIQLCGHGTHHRAQALNMLRRLGVEGPGLDLDDWAREGGNDP